MIGDAVGFYFAGMNVAWRRAKLSSTALVMTWFAFPVTLESCIHPYDVINFQAWLLGQPIQHLMTAQALFIGECLAIGSIAVVGMIQLCATALFFRSTRFDVKLWPLFPLAILFTGILGNAAWWAYMRHLDWQGSIAGFAPVVLVGICQAITERLGKDFVFGPGNRPQFQPEMDL